MRTELRTGEELPMHKAICNKHESKYWQTHYNGEEWCSKCQPPLWVTILRAFAFMAAFSALTFWAYGGCKPAHAAEISESLAVRALIGEASGEGYTGMVAVGEAIRNRGTLQGVYGVNAKHIDREPKWVFDRALKAWKASETSNLVKGASFWENTCAFGEPYWAKSMKKTAQIGAHSFYKAVSK